MCTSDVAKVQRLWSDWSVFREGCAALRPGPGHLPARRRPGRPSLLCRTPPPPLKAARCAAFRPLRRDSGGSEKGTRREQQWNKKAGKEQKTRKEIKKKKKRKKKKKERREGRDPPESCSSRHFRRNAHPNKCPKMHLRSGVAAAGMRLEAPGRHSCRPPRPRGENVMECIFTEAARAAFRGGGGVLHKREVQK